MESTRSPAPYPNYNTVSQPRPTQPETLTIPPLILAGPHPAPRLFPAPTYVFANEEEEAVLGVCSESEHDLGAPARLEAAPVQDDVAVAFELHRVRRGLGEITGAGGEEEEGVELVVGRGEKGGVSYDR